MRSCPIEVVSGIDLQPMRKYGTCRRSRLYLWISRHPGGSATQLATASQVLLRLPLLPETRNFSAVRGRCDCDLPRLLGFSADFSPLVLQGDRSCFALPELVYSSVSKSYAFAGACHVLVLRALVIQLAQEYVTARVALDDRLGMVTLLTSGLQNPVATMRRTHTIRGASAVLAGVAAIVARLTAVQVDHPIAAVRAPLAIGGASPG